MTYILDEWIQKHVISITEDREDMLTQHVKLVIKQKPKFISERMWLRCAGLFLEIHKGEWS